MEKPRVFQLAIQMDNAAFEDCQCGEVARILRRIADLIAEEYTLASGHCGIRDINGNRVGTYEAF